MLYKDLESYTPGLKIQKEGFILLDLTPLKGSVFKELFNRKGIETQMPQ
jgi:hypothetical protein